MKNLIEAYILHDVFPTSDSPNVKTHDVAYSVVELPPKNIAYTDLTSQFLYRFSCGNQYIFLVYDYDSNTILATSINNQSTLSIVKSWKSIHKELSKVEVCFIKRYNGLK